MFGFVCNYKTTPYFSYMMYKKLLTFYLVKYRIPKTRKWVDFF